MSFRTREQIKREEEEYRAARNIKPGVYPFEVKTAIEGRSSKGAHMVSLELCVWDDSNGQHKVKDWLGEWNYGDVKFLGFCESTGQPETYDAGKIRAIDCVDKQGYLVIKIEESEQYGAQPKVSFYVPRGDETSVKERYTKKQIPAEKYHKPASEVLGALQPVYSYAPAEKFYHQAGVTSPATDNDVPF